MSDHEIAAWLGGTALTDAQRESFERAWGDVADRYPDPDAQAERDAALSAALQYLLGETTPADAGRTLDRARAAELAATAAARQVAIMAIDDGASENALYADLRVTRRTLRKWQGKAG